MSLKEMMFDATVIPSLSKGLDAFARRQRAIAHNIANIETPGYQRQVVRFEDDLRSAVNSNAAGMKTTSQGHITANSNAIDKVDSSINVDTSPAMNGLNNVSLDQEMSDLATNNLQYQATARVIKQYFEGLRNAIRGGGSA